MYARPARTISKFQTAALGYEIPGVWEQLVTGLPDDAGPGLPQCLLSQGLLGLGKCIDEFLQRIALGRLAPDNDGAVADRGDPGGCLFTDRDFNK